KAQDVDGIADLRLALGETDRRVLAVRHAQERQVAPRAGQRLAGVVEQEQWAELLDLCLELGAVREQDRDLWLRLDLGAGERAADGVPADFFLDFRPRPDHESSSAERSEEHTSELQSRFDLVCRLLLEK